MCRGQICKKDNKKRKEKISLESKREEGRWKKKNEFRMRARKQKFRARPNDPVHDSFFAFYYVLSLSLKRTNKRCSRDAGKRKTHSAEKDGDCRYKGLKKTWNNRRFKKKKILVWCIKSNILKKMLTFYGWNCVDKFQVFQNIKWKSLKIFIVLNLILLKFMQKYIKWV